MFHLVTEVHRINTLTLLRCKMGGAIENHLNIVVTIKYSFFM
jgi:hypothetical protein